jgi:peroxiredoxin
MKHPSLLLATLTSLLLTPLAQAEDPAPSLADQLQAMQEKFSQMAPPEKQKAYNDGVKAVADSGLLDKAIKTGDKAPPFTLKNATGDEVSLASLLEKGPVVLLWYRGGWCPYCNIQLNAFQQALPDITAAGAQLVALTPELPDKSLNTKEKNDLDFEILSDLDQKVAREYGLVFKLTPEVAELYKEHFDLKEYNGPDAAYDELPLAATYVIDREGVIQWAFLHADYRKRAEPADIITALKHQ